MTTFLIVNLIITAILIILCFLGRRNQNLFFGSLLAILTQILLSYVLLGITFGCTKVDEVISADKITLLKTKNNLVVEYQGEIITHFNDAQTVNQESFKELVIHRFLNGYNQEISQWRSYELR